MFRIKLQYFFTFALMGAVLAYMPIYLAAQGLSYAQVGYVLSTFGVAIALSPVVMTFLADAHLQGKTLLLGTNVAAALMLGGLLAAESFWPILVLHLLYAMSFAPMMALQDGLNFREQRQRALAGQETVPFHRVRVWGTVGFIVPSLLLYVALAMDVPLGVILVTGIAVALCGAVNALGLPRHEYGPTNNSHAPPGEGADAELAEAGEVPLEGGSGVRRWSKLPTVEAARALLQWPVLVFCIAMWLCHLANGAFYGYYPLYLTDTLGVPEQWVGLITNIGVVVEIAFMLGFGWLVHRLGLRWLMVVGAVSMGVRLGLLFAFPNVAVGVGTQAFHGMMVLMIHVAPPIYLNYRAQEHFRSSMQGLFAMLIFGSGRILGTILAGWVADESLLEVFGWGAVLCGVAAALIAVAFRDRPGTKELVG